MNSPWLDTRHVLENVELDIITVPVFGTCAVRRHCGAHAPHLGDVSSDLAFVSSRTGVDVPQWQAMAG